MNGKESFHRGQQFLMDSSFPEFHAFQLCLNILAVVVDTYPFPNIPQKLNSMMTPSCVSLSQME